ncbi:MAG: tetratricopeptide repeat protein [Candidatus Thorarchaeota archaeon]
MPEDALIPEFKMYEDQLEESEIEELANRMNLESRTTKDKFMLFTDILSESVGSGEWRNRSEGFLAMCSKASFLRGMYGFNQILARGSNNLVSKGYAAAAYCKQSLDPRWLNNLRNYVNQAWQAKDYVAFAELSGQLALVLVDLGYNDRAQDVATESIDKVTKATTKDESIRNKVQSALLHARIIMALIDTMSGRRDEAVMRLDSAEDTAKLLNHELAQTDVEYYRALILEESHEYERALGLINTALTKYERMGYLQGVADARNLRGLIYLETGQLQDARDQFEELLITQQQLNNQIGLAKTLINVGEIDRGLGQLDQMETYNQRALEISQEAEYMRGIATATINLGDIALRRGETKDANELYLKSLDLAEGSGMKDLKALLHFLVGDSYFLGENLEEAMNSYSRAKKFADESNYPLVAFNADASLIVTQWEKGEVPEKVLIERVKAIIGSKEDWAASTDSSLMRDIREKVFEDAQVQSEMCIFYDRERSFECRVERKTLTKECRSNLFWMGALCPYFEEFLDRLYS